MGTRLVIQVLSRFTGAVFFEELEVFLTHFSSLFEGVRERMHATAELFASEKASFIIVTSPDPMTVKEAMYFQDKLDSFAVDLGALVVNRVRREYPDRRLLDGGDQAIAEALAEVEGAAIHGPQELMRIARGLRLNVEDIDALARRDTRVISALTERLDPKPVLCVPMYATDVHHLGALDRMRADLFENH